MRRALLAACAICLAGAASAEVSRAKLTQPTDRYDHGVLGDALEWGGMRLTGDGQQAELTLPPDRVFEDVTARVADLDGDGRAEVMVVETDLARGASLAVYDMTGRVAATPFIGQTHRWLAPLGAGDLDGDGLPEIAYVDRPHLRRELVVLRYRAGRLTEVARLSGLTNHRIGESTISGGFRNCDGTAEIVLADANWTRVMAVRLGGNDTLTARDIGPFRNAKSLTAALECRNPG